MNELIKAINELKKEKNKVIEFKKDIRFLWFYTSVFCIVLLALIGGSAVIQRKMHRQVEDYKNQAASAEESTKSTKSRLSNIQDENEQLKASNEALTFENNTLKAAAQTDSSLLEAAEASMTELEKLAQVGKLYVSGSGDAAALFNSIDQEKLPESAKETYEYYKERLK